MILPASCVVIAVDHQPAVASVGALEERCNAVLGAGSCRVVAPGSAPAAEAQGCWTATVTSPRARRVATTVVLRDPRSERAPARSTIAFRPQDLPDDRWAALGLLIAALVTVEQNATPAPPPPPPPEPAPQPPAPALASRFEDVQERQQERQRERQRDLGGDALAAPWAWDLRASGLLAAGPLPGLAWGVRLEGAFGGQRLAGLVRLSYLPTRTRALSGGGHGGAFRLVAPGAAACWRAGPLLPLSPRLCAGSDLQVTLARGYGLGAPARPTALSGAGWAGLSTTIRLNSRAALVAGIEGAMLFHRPRFAIDGASQVYTPGLLAGFASLGLAVSE